MNIKTIFLLAFSLCGFLVSAGENLVFNPSFELGAAGYSLTRYHFTERNPEMKFFPLAAVKESDGNHALQIKNPYGDSWMLSSKEFILEKNTEYEMSGRYRAVSGRQKFSFSVMTAFKGGWYKLGVTAVTAEKEWKSFKKKFKTKDKEDLYFHLELNGSGSQSSEILLDDMRVTKVSTPAPEKMQIHAILEPEKELYISNDNKENINATLKLWNPGKTAWNGKLDLTAKDEYFKTDIFKKTISVKLAAGETKNQKISIPVARYGAWRLLVSGDNVYSHDGYFVRMARYEAKPVNVLRDFVFSLNDGPRFDRQVRNAYEA